MEKYYYAPYGRMMLSDVEKGRRGDFMRRCCAEPRFADVYARFPSILDMERNGKPSLDRTRTRIKLISKLVIVTPACVSSSSRDPPNSRNRDGMLNMPDTKEALRRAGGNT
ncbi:hypothetical protein SRHO_G00273740 [Serrasalmus rhombeus]